MGKAAEFAVAQSARREHRLAAVRHDEVSQTDETAGVPEFQDYLFGNAWGLPKPVTNYQFRKFVTVYAY